MDWEHHANSNPNFGEALDYSHKDVELSLCLNKFLKGYTFNIVWVNDDDPIILRWHKRGKGYFIYGLSFVVTRIQRRSWVESNSKYVVVFY